MKINPFKSSAPKINPVDQLLSSQSNTFFAKVKEFFGLASGSSRQIASLANKTVTVLNQKSGAIDSKDFKALIASVKLGMQQRVKADVSDRDVAKIAKAILNGKTSVTLAKPLSKKEKAAAFKAIDKEFKIGLIAEHPRAVKAVKIGAVGTAALATVGAGSFAVYQRFQG